MKASVLRIILTAMFLAVGLAIVLLSGGDNATVNALAPVQFLVLLCGLMCGGIYGGIVGVLVPFLSALLLGQISFYPDTIVLALELFSYGVLAGWMRKVLDNGWIAQILAMLGGRVVLGISSIVMLAIVGRSYSFDEFLGRAVLHIWPGLILQLILLPLIYFVLKKTGVLKAVRP